MSSSQWCTETHPAGVLDQLRANDEPPLLRRTSRHVWSVLAKEAVQCQGFEDRNLDEVGNERSDEQRSNWSKPPRAQHRTGTKQTSPTHQRRDLKHNTECQGSTDIETSTINRL